MGPESNELREALADYAHQAWSGWMDYLFANSMVTGAYGSVTIPAHLARRWKRQAATFYADLLESEKESDREEADQMMAIMLEKVVE